MRKKQKNLQQLVLWWVFFSLLVTAGSWLLRSWFSPSPELTLGVTYSTRYAEELGLDWQEVYVAVLDDLHAEQIRIPLYWSEIEKTAGVRDFTQIDWLMDQAAQRQVKVTLVIGEKVPRWPECYVPMWAQGVSKQKVTNALEAYLQATVERYQSHPALARWQIENEYTFPFGVCAAPEPKRLQQEIDLVRTLDPDHPIQLTTSGEQSWWVVAAQRADVLGVSMYQRVWSDYFGFLILPVSPVVYAVQGKIAGLFADKVIISELQAEPWLPGSWERGDINQLDRLYNLFTAQDLLLHLTWARQSGVDEVYFWGVEWWYYLKQQGEPALWLMAKQIFSEND